MKYSDILDMVLKVNSGEEKTGYEFEPDYCPICGSNQYNLDKKSCLTCNLKAERRGEATT